VPLEILPRDQDKNWPRPKNKKEVERFLGFTNYHRAFIEEYTQMAFPLQALTGKRTYQWGDEQEKPGPGYCPGKPEPLSNSNPSAPG
jgi:hypothetical protein